jgi:hypothetical protein
LRKSRDVTGIQDAGNAGNTPNGTPKKPVTPRKRATPIKNGAKAMKPEKILKDEEVDDDICASLKKEYDSELDDELSPDEESPSKRPRNE